jgi:hypothetical protein
LTKTDGRYESAATLAAELRSVAAVRDVRSGEKEPPTLATQRLARPAVPRWVIVAAAIGALAALVWLATRVS